jgi:hypothetical protein
MMMNLGKNLVGSGCGLMLRYYLHHSLGGTEENHENQSG